MVSRVLKGRALVAGSASGEVLALAEPLSLWGGLNPVSGLICDAHHPQVGVSTAGKILVMPHGRGSSSASSVLAECIRCGTGPVAIIMQRPDPIIVIGALAAGEIYPQRSCPIVVVSDIDFALVLAADSLNIDNGIVELK